MSLIESGESIETVSTLDGQQETGKLYVGGEPPASLGPVYAIRAAVREKRTTRQGVCIADCDASKNSALIASVKKLRDLVAKMFTITSEFELDLDEGNPLAPLLRIGMLQNWDRRSGKSIYEAAEVVR